MHAEKITQIRKIGKINTMDISVDSDSHIFYGNGIATSNSHAVSYAFNSFLSAHAKAHFPIQFFASYLKHADGKQDHYQEIKELIDNAKIMNINVYGPNIQLLNERFEIIKDDIYYGLVDIKSVGHNDYEIITKCAKEKPSSLSNFDQFVFGIGIHLSKDTTIALIESGALDCFKLSRNYMSYVYKLFLDIGKREMQWVKENYTDKDTIISILELMLEVSANLPAKQRPIYKADKVKIIQSILNNIKKPAYDTNDSIMWIATQEQKYLGYELSCSKIDIYNSVEPSCTCKDFLNGYGGEKTLSLVVEIKSSREYEIKSGKNKGNKMLFLTIADHSCSMDNVTVFSDKYEEYKSMLYKGNVVHVIGKRDKKKGGFIVDKVKEMA